jgi:hypothetical protein
VKAYSPRSADALGLPFAMAMMASLIRVFAAFGVKE